MQWPRLRSELLESRTLPAGFGIPWSAPETITISFAPDAAPVEDQPSSLVATMSNAGISETVWKGEILRAFQTWADVADVQLRTISDDGSAYGATGSMQGDERFGDIRIFARPLSSNVYAITTPPDRLSGTRTGDIIFNTNQMFTVNGMMGADLYTIALQEAGHALGIGDSTNNTSAMYDFYNGPRTGLSSEDEESIQRLYGPRTNWLGDASDISSVPTTLGTTSSSSQIATYGDLTGVSDVDFYHIQVADPSSPLTVRLLTSDYSLLAGRITLFDSQGVQVAQASASGPSENIHIFLADTTGLGSSFTLRVDGVPSSPFTVGKYRLVTAVDETASVEVILPSQVVSIDNGTDNTFATATLLSPEAGIMSIGDIVTRYQTIARTEVSHDADVYLIETPNLSVGQMGECTIHLSTIAGTSVPNLEVFDAAMNPIASEVISSSDRAVTVRIRNAQPNSTYFIRVGDENDNPVGAYQLDVAFQRFIAQMTPLQTGTISASGPIGSNITVASSVAVQFWVAAWNGTASSAATMTIRNEANEVILSLEIGNELAQGAFLVLHPGQYRVEFAGTPGISYLLLGASLTDPMGIFPTNPIGEPPVVAPPIEDPAAPPIPWTDPDYWMLILYMQLDRIGIVIGEPSVPPFVGPPEPPPEIPSHLLPYDQLSIPAMWLWESLMMKRF